MLIKKLIIAIFSLSYCFFSYSFIVFCVDYPDVSARSAVLLNAQTNEVVFEKNKDERLSMASTTKIMTSLLAIESGRLHCVVTAKNDVICEGTAIGIKKGDSFTLETLVYAMLLESGNDAAILTAEYLAGSEHDFALLMNKKAKEIGMTSTNFVTASGLDAENHSTTAHDMAVLGSYAIKNPVFKKICSAESYSARYINPEISATYYNHNKLLHYYDGVFGVKTGFTKMSGRCLVSACEKEGVTLVAVTLNAGDDWDDHIKMLDYGFSVLKKQDIEVSFPKEVRVYGSDKTAIKVNIEGKSYTAGDIKCKIHIDKWYYAPVSSGDILGYADIYHNGKLIDKLSIYASESADSIIIDNKPKFDFWYKFKQIFA